MATPPFVSFQRPYNTQGFQEVGKEVSYKEVDHVTIWCPALVSMESTSNAGGMPHAPPSQKGVWYGGINACNKS